MNLMVHAVRNKDLKSSIIVPRMKTCGNYKCKICQKEIRNKANYAGHHKTIHRGIQYLCDKCDFRTNYHERL